MFEQDIDELIPISFRNHFYASTGRTSKYTLACHCLGSGHPAEQFPLKNEITQVIAKENGIKHPHSESHVMTTDFLVTKSDGRLHAYSVKPDRKLSERALQILCIEKIYWNIRGYGFDLLFKSDVNMVLAANIRLVIAKPSGTMQGSITSKPCQGQALAGGCFFLPPLVQEPKNSY